MLSATNSALGTICWHWHTNRVWLSGRPTCGHYSLLILATASLMRSRAKFMRNCWALLRAGFAGN